MPDDIHQFYKQLYDNYIDQFYKQLYDNYYEELNKAKEYATKEQVTEIEKLQTNLTDLTKIGTLAGNKDKQKRTQNILEACLKNLTKLGTSEKFFSEMSEKIQDLLYLKISDIKLKYSLIDEIPSIPVIEEVESLGMLPDRVEKKINKGAELSFRILRLNQSLLENDDDAIKKSYKNLVHVVCTSRNFTAKLTTGTNSAKNLIAQLVKNERLRNRLGIKGTTKEDIKKEMQAFIKAEKLEYENLKTRYRNMEKEPEYGNYKARFKEAIKSRSQTNTEGTNMKP